MRGIVGLSVSVVALAAILSLGISAHAGDHVWTSGGPEGGWMQCVAVSPSDPRIIFAGADGGGVFKSLDGGESWAPANRGLGASNFSFLFVHPTRQGRVLAAGDEGLFLSEDLGDSWTRVETAQWFWNVDAVAFDPADPDRAYMAQNWSFFESRDGGAHWEFTCIAPPSYDITCIAMDPSRPEVVYAGSWGDGLFKSEDGGASWTKLPLEVSNIWLLALDPGNPEILYAGTDWLWKSADGGQSWSLIGAGGQALAIDPRDARVLLVARGAQGIWKSPDAGQSWYQLGSGIASEWVSGIAFDPSNSNRIFAAADHAGIFRTQNGGMMWSRENSGLAATNVTALALDPVHPGVAYAGTFYEGFFRTEDGGSSWRSLGQGPAGIAALILDPVTPSTIYAATGLNGVFKSSDSGATWTLLGAPRAFMESHSLAMDPSDPKRLYAALWDKGLYGTEDGGLTWSRLDIGVEGLEVSAVCVDPRNRLTLYAGSWQGGAFRSRDGGATWAPIHEGLATYIGIETILVSPADSSTVYLLGSNTYYRSRDGGDHWTLQGYNLVASSPLLDPSNPEALAAGQSGGWGPARSTDGGVTWEPFGHGLENTFVRCLAADPFDPTKTFAGTYGAGVFTIRTPATPCALQCAATATTLSGGFPRTVLFSAQAAGSGCLSEPGYFWFFGDGRRSTEPNPVHTYSEMGTFNWTLTVVADGQECALGGEITVDPCFFSVASTAAPCGAPLEVAFSAEVAPGDCVGHPLFGWDFGDGATSVEQNPHHTYAQPGTYRWTIEVRVARVAWMDSGFVAITAGGGLPGDCDGNGSVSIGEVQKAINMFLGTQATGCGVDCNGDGTVSIGEVQKVINAFLGLATGC